MIFLIHNHIFRKGILALFVVCMLLTPLSMSVTHFLSKNVASAVDTTLTPEARSAQDARDKVTGANAGISPSAPAQTAKNSSLGIKWILDFVGNFIGTILLNIAAALTGIAGQLLDYVMNQLVLGMANKINTTTFGQSIKVAWGVIRDICNLIFIFGFIYTGFRTIIDPEHADTKRFLSRIIIGALLINFSLFIVKIVIDFSNFLAFTIYSAMTTGGATVTQTITNSLGIITFYNTGKIIGTLFANTSIWFFLLGALFLLATAFVFFAASLFLVIRFVALVFIMVGSPILFAATVFPQTENYASDLWKKLLGYSFFAPVYILLTFLSIRIIQGLNMGSHTDFSSLLSGEQGVPSGDAASTILNFIIVISFMIGSLTIAHKMGVAGSDMVVKFAGGMSYGLAARLNRATIGRLAHSISEKDGLKDTASKRGFVGWGARRILKGSRVVADSSLDFRNAPGGKMLNAGEGRKGGYATVMGEVEKKEKEFAQSLGEIGDDDVHVQARKHEMETGDKTLKDLNKTLSNTKEQRRILQTQIADAKKKGESTTILERDLAKTDADIVKQEGIIEKQEKDNKDKKLQYESEKQRRIIGSTYANENRSDSAQKAAATWEKDITDQKDKIKKLWKDYNTLADEKAKAKRRKEIAEFNEELDKLKKKQRKFLNDQYDQGYASVGESSNIFTAWPMGRLVVHDNEAGKAIRKTAEKGLPKKKDE